MKMSLFVSLCCSVAFYSSACQAACVQPPSCDELGFTADVSKCDGSFLKCPWDLTKAACKENKITTPTELPILYGDSTVAKGLIDGKTPIGIVFDEANKLAVALTDILQDGTSGSNGMKLVNKHYGDMPSLKGCLASDITSGTASTPITCGVDGRTNTVNILADCNRDCDGTLNACNSMCGGTPATTACNLYEPENCTKDFCKKTKWFLPSLRDLQNIYAAKDQLNTTLASLDSSKATEIGTNWYWSSTKFNGNYVWRFAMLNGNKKFVTSYENNAFVRPVIYFGEPKITLPILYGDGTISKEIIPDKTPIGVVFDENNKLAIALTDANIKGIAGTWAMKWSDNPYSIPNLSSCTGIRVGDNLTPITCNVDGRENTDKILSCGSGCDETTVATVTNNYAPTGCTKDFCKKTKWFLPSMRDLQNMYMAKDQLDTTLISLNGKDTSTIGNKTYWSSTVYGYSDAWYFQMSKGMRGFQSKTGSNFYVRPVIAF